MATAAKKLTQPHAAVLKQLLGPLNPRNSAAALLRSSLFQAPIAVGQCVICGEENKQAAGSPT